VTRHDGRSDASTLLTVGTISENVAKGAGCDVASLVGTYGGLFSGDQSAGGRLSPAYPLVGAGLFKFYGAGHLVGNFASNSNGVGARNNPYTANYTVKPICTGLIIGMNGGDNFSFVMVNGGTEIFAVDLSRGELLSLDLKQQ
jgi:hypothetical protein